MAKTNEMSLTTLRDEELSARLVDARRQDQNRHPTPATQPLADLNTVEARQR